MRRTRAALAALALLASLAASCPGEETLLAATEPWGRYMRPDLPGQGFLPSVASRALEGSPYAVRVRFYPWARALALVESGGADLLLGAYRNEERAALMLYSAPVAVSVDSLFGLKSRRVSYRNLDDLRPYSIGVVRGALHGEAFDRADFLLKEESDSLVRNLEKLMASRVAPVAGPREVILPLLRERFPDRFEEVVELQPSLQANTVHFAVSRRRPDCADVVRAIDSGLERLRADGGYAALEREFGIGR